MTACLQQGYPLFFQPLPEAFPGMAKAVEGAAGGHHQPRPHRCQKGRQEGAVRTVMRRQQDIGLHLLTAGQQMPQGGHIGIARKKGQAVAVPDQTQDQGGAVALPQARAPGTGRGGCSTCRASPSSG